MGVPVPAGAKEYNVQLNVLPSRWARLPKEENSVIPIFIDWSVGNVQHVNVQGLTTKPFTQIIAAYINNVRNTSVARLIFPDTQLPLDIPAGTQILIPITTERLDFTISADNPNSTDYTVIELFNSQPPPVALTAVQLESTGSTAAIDMSAAAAVYPLVAAGINGNLSAINISFTGATAGGGAGSRIQIAVVDGTGKQLFFSTIQAPAAAVIPSGTVLNMSGMVIPFTNGLSVVTTGVTAFVNGWISVNAAFQS